MRRCQNERYDYEVTVWHNILRNDWFRFRHVLWHRHHWYDPVFSSGEGVTMTDKCHCGSELHYWCRETEIQMLNLVDKLGRFIHVTVGDKTYKVDRHYIALHGITGADVPSLGFEEVKHD
jgi:hypothetical protein